MSDKKINILEDSLFEDKTIENSADKENKKEEFKKNFKSQINEKLKDTNKDVINIMNHLMDINFDKDYYTYEDDEIDYYYDEDMDDEIDEDQKSDHEKEFAKLITKYETMPNLLDNVLTPIFKCLLDKKSVKIYQDAVKIMPKCIFARNYNRRSHRSHNVRNHVNNIKKLLDFVLVGIDIKGNYQDLLTNNISDFTEHIRNNSTNFAFYEINYSLKYSCTETIRFIMAAKIDNKNQDVIDFFVDAINSETNTVSVNYAMICTIIASSNDELHDLLIKFLLAAKLQEGLRQSIFENADFGSKEFMQKILNAILENNLLRFSSCLRAVCTWIGLGYDYEDKRIITKYVTLMSEYFADPKKRKKAFNSKDVVEMYVAMWVETYDEFENIKSYLEKYMNGKKYQKVVVLSFLNEIDDNNFKTEFAIKYLEQEDLDLFVYVFQNYNASTQYFSQYNKTKKDFIKYCKEFSFLEDESSRKKIFDILIPKILELPKNDTYTPTYQIEGISYAYLSKSEIIDALYILVGFDTTEEYLKNLFDVIDKTKSDRAFVLKFIINPEGSQIERKFIIDSLKGRVAEKETALSLIKNYKLSLDEITQVEKLLNLKSTQVRKGALKIISMQTEETITNIIEGTFKSKNEMRRLAGLDLISSMFSKDKIKKEKVDELIGSLNNINERENALIDVINQIGSKQELPLAQKYNKKNGFGFYDVDFVPKAFEIEKVKTNYINTFLEINAKEIVSLINSLASVVFENKEHKYKSTYYDGSVNEITLGEHQYLVCSANIKEAEDFPLYKLWQKWIKDNKIDYLKYLQINFALNSYLNNYLTYLEEDFEICINKIINTSEIKKLKNYYINISNDKVEPEYLKLAKNILSKFDILFEKEIKTKIDHDLSIEFYKIIDENGFLNKIVRQKEQYDYQKQDYVKVPEYFVETPLARYLFYNEYFSYEDDEMFNDSLKMILNMSKNDENYTLFGRNEVARGILNGILPENEIFRTFVEIKTYSYHNRYKKEDNKTKEDKFIADNKIIFEQRIIDIELTRFEAENDASDYVSSITTNYGAKNFVNILIALGDDTFTRGYSYNKSKKDSISHLLSTNVPNKEDTADKLRELVNEKINDTRILEAAMYVPKWVDIIDEYLGWNGLKSGVWYFHAHTSESLPEFYETEIAKFSPITTQEFSDGAFDINWFKEVHKNLGKEKFNKLYDTAKYIGGGSVHKRSQRFSDAVLGKINKKELEKEISDKRNKDKLLSYSLIPFNKKDKMLDALKRYEFIQKFLKESKKFGSMRQTSEQKVCDIALDNLARNLGFKDSLRFGWKMEVLKIESIQKYFQPKTIDEIEITFEIDDSGAGNLITTKKGKILKSVPAKYKKNKYVKDLMELRKNLKDQFRRGRKSFEESMETKDEFEFNEIQELLNHPVIKQIVNKLVFKTAKGTGFLTSKGLVSPDKKETSLKKDDILVVAHPYDLMQSGLWSDFQKYIFENEIIQPFKQVFRELYIINEDEKKEKTISRRYQGNQVQPKRTIALLKTRGWTVDYDQGLQKVYYTEDIIVNIYAMADWFSPSDIEAPTLETIEFHDRKNYKSIPLEEIDPIIFSEVMRDLDLVVSVAHVGGVDPETSHSTIEMRGMIITETLKLMKIENAKIDGNHVKIKGAYGEYTVHLGSGISHKMGKGALNILAVHSQHRGKLFIPFMDEDPKTAEIVSKVYFLSNDTKIKDPMILNQIKD